MNYYEYLKRGLNINGYSRKKDKNNEYIVSKQSTEYDQLQSNQEEFEVDANSQYSFWRVRYSGLFCQRFD